MKPMLAISKLEQLAWLAATAEVDIDKAALYGATISLVSELNGAEDMIALGMGEPLERARWSICSMLGYEDPNEHDKDTHLVWALGLIAIMRRNLNGHGALDR
ncbi:MAG: hypothetical protein H6935_05495 [Thiobacillus sp.]|nr:hypothetical protein [Thiobacillus sp.]